jgi:hypothetical protein
MQGDTTRVTGRLAGEEICDLDDATLVEEFGLKDLNGGDQV